MNRLSKGRSALRRPVLVEILEPRRLFSRFDDDGLIAVQQKHVRILDIPGLRTLVTRETH